MAQIGLETYCLFNVAKTKIRKDSIYGTLTILNKMQGWAYPPPPDILFSNFSGGKNENFHFFGIFGSYVPIFGYFPPFFQLLGLFFPSNFWPTKISNFPIPQPMHSGLNQGDRGTSACFRMEIVENYCFGLIFDHLR